jgi:hypothetical protein
MALITAKTRVAIKFRTANTDDFYYYGYAYLTSVNADAPNQGNVTYSGSFTGDGALSLQSSSTGETGGGGITAITAGMIISGLSDLYVYTGTDPVAVELDHIDAIAGKIPMVNQGSETVSISSVDDLLIDGNASIDLAPGQEITIFPNDTKFEVTGTYGAM